MGAASSVSIDGSRADRAENQSIVDENDEVPDVPMPVSEFPEEYDEYKEPDDVVTVPMQSLSDRTGSEDGDSQRSFVPLSPKIIVESKQTEV